MIDQDDADVFALLWPGGGGALAVVGLILWALIQYSACQNEKACAAHVCLIHGECLCVREATP